MLAFDDARLHQLLGWWGRPCDRNTAIARMATMYIVYVGTGAEESDVQEVSDSGVRFVYWKVWLI